MSMPISEFEKDGYIRSFIEKFIVAAMCIPDSEAYEPKIVELLNTFLLSDRLKTSSWNKDTYLSSDTYKNMLERLDITILDMLNDFGDNYKEYVVDFEEEFQKLKEALEVLPENALFDTGVSYKYLNMFLQISAKTVFNPDNNNLNNLVFRKSQTIESLYGLGRIPFVRANTNRQENEGYSYFNICNPFVLDSLRRIIDTIVERKSFSRVPFLRELRIGVFQDLAQRSFSRFTSYNNFNTYKVALNKNNNEIISVPYQNLSSIEPVKPIFLFEKIACHIQKQMTNFGESYDKMTNFGESCDKFININILLIGHSEDSFNSENEYGETELCDLIRSVLAWYSTSFASKTSPKLKLKITNIVNNGDFCSSLEIKDHKREQLSGNYCDQEYELNIKTVNYKSEFYFSSSKLKEYCSLNDLVFIIDCPWLIIESYELKKDVSLGMYARRVNRLKSFLYYSADKIDSEKQTILQELDTQYNRITSSDSSMHGDIARVFRDKVLDDIKSIARDNNKEIYLLTSEKDGVDYSLLGSHPLTKNEQYFGKKFTVAMFSNATPSRLSVSEKPAPFVIRLWDMLKYISVSYMYTSFRDSLEKLVGDYVQSPEQYFELMRDVFVVVEPGVNLKELTISVRFSERINVLFSGMHMTSRKRENIKKKLFALVFPLVYSLYTEVIFSEYNDFGNNLIQKGFKLNLIESASDVNDMVFIHEYNKAVANHLLDRYVLNWKKEYVSACYADDNFSDESFLDKNLYYILLHNLEYNDSLNIGALAMLNRANKTYHTPAMAHRLMKNIVSVYDAAELDYFRIAQNTRNAIKELK